MYRRAHHEGRPRPVKVSVAASDVIAPCTYLALKVVITGEQEAAGDRKANGCDAAKN